jgi:hypothetical protein
MNPWIKQPLQKLSANLLKRYDTSGFLVHLIVVLGAVYAVLNGGMTVNVERCCHGM